MGEGGGGGGEALAYFTPLIQKYQRSKLSILKFVKPIILGVVLLRIGISQGRWMVTGLCRFFELRLLITFFQFFPIMDGKKIMISHLFQAATREIVIVSVKFAFPGI